MKWSLIVSRRISILWSDMAFSGYTSEYFKKTVGYETSYTFLRNINFDWSVSEEEFFNETKIVKKLLKENPRLFAQSAKNAYIIGDGLIDCSKRLEKKDYTNVDNDELLNLFEEFFEKFKMLSPYLQHAHAVANNLEKILRSEIKNKLGSDDSKIDNYLGILTAPLKKNDINIAEEDTLKMALHYQKTKDENELNKSLDTYIYRNSWNTARYGYGEPLEKSLARKDVLNIENPQEKIKELENYEKNLKASYEDLQKKLGLNEDVKYMVDLAKEYVYLRTYRTDVLNESFFRIRPFLMAIADKFNISLEHIISLTSNELVDLLKGDFDIKNIDQRLQGVGYEILNGHKKIYVGKELENKIREISPDFSDVRELSGNIANGGIAKGPVSIVRSVKDVPKVKKGDILVAAMTTPDHIAAMKLAGAFVTDEGGITCHAAIVAREMKKPCVIGTKIATKVLQDGDLVQVNADEGKVTIITKK